jgi:hypothetical protein
MECPMIICARVCGSSWAFHVFIFIVFQLPHGSDGYRNPKMIIRGGCAAARGDFIAIEIVSLKN